MGRMTNKSFPIRVPHYETEHGMLLLKTLAERRGLSSVTALLRELTREEAKRTKVDWEVAGNLAADYYDTDPEVAAWQAVGDYVDAGEERPPGTLAERHAAA